VSRRGRLERSTRAVLAGFVLLGIAINSATWAAEPQTWRGSTMGTTYTVRVAGGITDPEGLQQRIEELLEEVNDQMSTWRDDSELSRFNRHRDDTWFSVSPATATVVAEAQRIAADTDGAFDVTVGPLVNLWQFGPETVTSAPTPAEIEQRLRAVGHHLLEVRLDPPSLRKLHPECYVDLSGIAKGFGVDQVAQLLQREGYEAFLVEIGGEIRTGGEKAPGVPWTVGIEAPVVAGRFLQRALPLTDQSLATSGDYRNFRLVDGRQVSHTIDPRTGQPVAHTLASVTVVTPECLEADALATALMVLGPADALAWATTRDVAALIIVREPDGSFTELPSPRFLQQFPIGRPAATPRAEGGANMQVFLITLVVFLIAVAAMAVGVLWGRRGIRGTCGGLANFKDSQGRPMCDACHDPSPSCEGTADGQRRDAAQQNLG
jgi:FAD:protein FMN transferase